MEERPIKLRIMAYSTLLASVPDNQVMAFREGSLSILEADISIRCSQLLTSWVGPSDLRDVLREAIDCGQILRADLWHPFRAPVWHPSRSAFEIETKLRKVWNEQLEKAIPIDPADWYVVEIGKVVKVFGHAATHHNGIVSFLEEPTDEERAQRVFIPVVDRRQNSSST
jgi:hypothetical protein